ncbi:MAG: hypothetical protein JXA42_21120, partial [Anaerolineales bacterium]|nr:hypothetical protein [Anaerolineales bacterium]
MIKSLGSRLLASYTFIILICLAVVGIAMWLLLFQLSLPDRQLYQELTAKSHLVLLRPVGEELLRDPSSQRTEQTLKRLSDAIQARLLLIKKDGRIIADSQGTLLGQNLTDKARLVEETNSVIRGSLRPA